MPLVKAVCTNCGAPLEVDNAKDAAICPYCSTPYIVEKAINRYVTNIQNLNAGVVNLIQPDKKEQLFTNAEAQLKLGEYSAAFKSYQSLSTSYANDPRSWAGLLGAKSQNKRVTSFSIKEVEEITKYYKHLKQLNPAASEEWEDYVDQVHEALNASSNSVDSLRKKKKTLERKIIVYKIIAIVFLIVAAIIFILLDSAYQDIYQYYTQGERVLFAVHIGTIILFVGLAVLMFFLRNRDIKEKERISSKIAAISSKLLDKGVKS